MAAVVAGVTNTGQATGTSPAESLSLPVTVFDYANVPTQWLSLARESMSRIYEGRHFPSDVVFGSALGIAAGWTVVGRHGRKEYSLTPVPIRGGMAFMVTRAR